MAVTDDKITATIARYSRLLDKRPQAPESLLRAPESELRVILERSGIQRKSTVVTERLQAAFADAGIATFPLSDPFLKRTDRVRMFHAQNPI